MHPAAPHHLPFYLAPGSGTDVLMVVMGIFLVGTVLWVGTLYWKLHSLPERMAHKSQKLEFEMMAVLGIISLFTHMHIFWVAGLLLAMIDLPDSARRCAASQARSRGSPTPRPARVASPNCLACRRSRSRSSRKRCATMLELMICSLVTILPDYLYRRYAQGKRFGHEITFFSVWYELRWGITGCLMLTIVADHNDLLLSSRRPPRRQSTSELFPFCLKAPAASPK